MKDFFTLQKYDRRSIILYGVVALLALGYAVGLFFQPALVGPQAFEIGAAARALLKITIAVPIVLVWFFGATAISASFLRAQGIADDTPKVLFRYMGFGLSFLVMGLIAGTIIGEIRSYFLYDPAVQRIGTILVNYSYVFPPLAGFMLLFRGTCGRYADMKALTDQNGVVALVLVAIVGALWTGIIFTNTGRQTSAIAGISPSFYVGDATIIATIIIPTLLSWFFGVMAALRLSDVFLKVVDYERERAFANLVSGIWLLIFSYIIIFGLLAVGAERLLALGLGGILVAIYLFLFALLAAHWLIADSVKRLGKENI